jgi:YlmC/YmxH family sporulation protein
MKEKGLDFKHKEVINITDGKRMGYVQDVTAELETGKINSIIVPGSNSRFNIFSQNSDIEIPWNQIECIGNDVILVRI